jgi:hypothetical protein
VQPGPEEGAGVVRTKELRVRMGRAGVKREAGVTGAGVTGAGVMGAGVRTGAAITGAGITGAGDGHWHCSWKPLPLPTLL